MLGDIMERPLGLGKLKVAHAFALAIVILAIIFPFFFKPTSGILGDVTFALAYATMGLGLNIVVGFAGLLDLGYVAFYAFGAYAAGWFASGFYAKADLSVLSSIASGVPGIHLNFILIVIIAIIITAIAGILIGLPTLRLRGDYIAVVTLAFGEIIRVFAINGNEIKFADGWPLTAGRQGITPIDQLKLPFMDPFDPFNERPWYWLALTLVLIAVFICVRLRDSRVGRAWVAIREDEVAAASMGVPLVKTKLVAYAAGAAIGGMSGAFLGFYQNTVNADQFAFSFSIFALAMIILGGLGSIWGALVGSILLTMVTRWFIPDVINDIPGKIGLNFEVTQVQFGIFGFILVLMMVLRPQGLIPEKRHKAEFSGEVEVKTPASSIVSGVGGGA